MRRPKDGQVRWWHGVAWQHKEEIMGTRGLVLEITTVTSIWQKEPSPTNTAITKKQWEQLEMIKVTKQNTICYIIMLSQFWYGIDLNIITWE